MKKGGLVEMEKINIAKANLLYNLIDTTDFYHCPVANPDRSRMNVPFTLKNTALDGEFLKQAQARGMFQLKGHRSVGGMRASIYNAMPIEGVATLVEFMKEFASNHAWPSAQNFPDTHTQSDLYAWFEQLSKQSLRGGEQYGWTGCNPGAFAQYAKNGYS